MLMSVLSFLQEAPFKPSIFGEDLELIISLPSHCDNGLKIPKIVPFLADAVLKMNGLQSEGIFRVPGDAEEVTDLVCLCCPCIILDLMLTTPFLYSVFGLKMAIMMQVALPIPMYQHLYSNTGFETLKNH